jgi:hypothetical protein
MPAGGEVVLEGGHLGHRLMAELAPAVCGRVGRLVCDGDQHVHEPLEGGQFAGL